MYKFNEIFRNSVRVFSCLNFKAVSRLNVIKSYTNWSSLTPGNYFQRDIPKCNLPKNVAIALSVLTWLGFTKEDEEKESELIMTLKRAVLCTQREQYEKAEQMLHLALRIAQQQQNQQGVLYCYDLMANLAFDTYELAKAEKLFVSVLQMLLSQGMPDDNLKVCQVLFCEIK